MNTYVGNLNYRVKEEELAKAMGAYGPVTSVKVIKDRETGKSKGFAFVEMENAEDARQPCQRSTVLNSWVARWSSRKRFPRRLDIT